MCSRTSHPCGHISCQQRASFSHQMTQQGQAGSGHDRQTRTCTAHEQRHKRFRKPTHPSNENNIRGRRGRADTPPGEGRETRSFLGTSGPHGENVWRTPRHSRIQGSRHKSYYMAPWDPAAELCHDVGTTLGDPKHLRPRAAVIKPVCASSQQEGAKSCKANLAEARGTCHALCSREKTNPVAFQSPRNRA